MLYLMNGAVWDEKYYNRQCFAHVELRDEMLNLEEDAHFENEQREVQKRLDEEPDCGYW